MRGQPAVETDQTLLLPDKLKALHQASIFQPPVCQRRLSQPRPRDLDMPARQFMVPSQPEFGAGTHLVRIRQDRRHQLRATCRARLSRMFDCVVPPSLLTTAGNDALLAVAQRLLHLFVQDPLQSGLGRAEVAGAHALEEATDALVPEHLPYAVHAVPVLPGRGVARALRHVLVQLQARLDEPDWVRRGASSDSRGETSRQVDPGSLVAAVAVLGDEPLAVAVHVEVDGARGDDAHQVGPQALEQRAPPLLLAHRAQYLQRLGQVE